MPGTVSAGARHTTDLCIRNYNNPCPAGALGFDEYPTTIDRFRAAPDQGTYTDPHGPSINVPMYELFLASAR